MHTVERTTLPPIASTDFRDLGEWRPQRRTHPLGPLVLRGSAQRPVVARLVGAAILAACIGLLGIAARVQPDRAGLGSHRQLGLPPCSMLMFTGYPCPTCGMTTAFAHAVRGQFVSAFLVQPAGLGLALATAGLAILSASTMITGGIRRLNWYRVPPGRCALGIAAALFGAWAFKLAFGLASGTLPLRW